MYLTYKFCKIKVFLIYSYEFYVDPPKKNATVRKGWCSTIVLPFYMNLQYAEYFHFKYGCMK